jgi:hypothetical protein
MEAMITQYQILCFARVVAAVQQRAHLVQSQCDTSVMTK